MSGRKTLLPELLPDPRPRPAQGPRERVTARARVMLDKLAGWKTAAGAAVLAAHCGYGVVDPLPPPPAQCTSLGDPFAGLKITGTYFQPDGGAAEATFTIQNARVFGYGIDAVRVTAGGTLQSFTDEHLQGSSTWGTDFLIVIVTDGTGGPMLFEVDLTCGGAATTKHYKAMLAGSAGYDVVALD